MFCTLQVLMRVDMGVGQQHWYKQVELSLSNPCLMYVERSVGMRKSTGNDRGHG